MHAPKWKLFSVLWAVTVLLWVLPYVVQRFGGLDVKDAFSGYPWNFSPFYAVSLFGGAFLANRALSVILPVVAYAVVNLAIYWLSGKSSWATQPEVWFNYALFALFPLFGIGLEKQASPALPALGRSFTAAVLFFVLSNLPAFWMSYPRTLAGLGDCYYMALPFFPATLGSSLLFTAALFSPVGLKMATQPALK
jgi:hypothetical protein